MSANITDIPQWLSNRLGSSEKAWVDGSIAPFLTKELLKGVYDCFLDLQSSIKSKLLLSFLHIVRRSVDNLRPELEAIVELAIKDPDQWVSLIAEFLRNFPAKGEFNLQIVENADVFSGMRNDIRKHLKVLADRSGDLTFLPFEAEFMNRKAFMSTFGNAPPPAKHFTLKQKPKSATLRADALAKATDTSKPRTQSGSSLPIRFKDQGKAETLGAISAAAKRAYAAGPQARVQANKDKQTVTAKSRGGVKLLDITDTPLGQEQGSKRRRKLVGVPVAGSGEAKDTEDQPESGETTERPESPSGSGIPNETPESPSKSQIPVLSPDTSVAATFSPNSQTPGSSKMTISGSGDTSPLLAHFSSVLSSPQIIQPVGATDLRNVKLTKELQESIADIFKNANRVTRPEKVLIVNFIAGGRDNPCPHLGSVLTIRLSEHTGKVTLPDGNEEDIIFEEYFHMNFSTGEWKRLRKSKPVVKDGNSSLSTEKNAHV